MIVVAQIVTLTALGLIAVEAALYTSQYSGAWWVISGTAVVSYIGLLSGVFLQDKDWVPVLFKRIYQTVFSTLARGLAAALLSATISLGGAVHIYSWWPKSQLIVTVFEKSFPSNLRSANVIVFVQAIGEDSDITFKPTDATGNVAFPIKRDDRLNVAIRTERDGQSQYGRLPQYRVQALPDYLQIRIQDIPGDAWRPATDSIPPSAPVALVTIDRSHHHPISSPIIAEVDAKLHGPWGLPSAPLRLHRTAYSLGYDPRLRVPTWLAHRIQQPPDANYERPSVAFSSDPNISNDLQATNADYRGSGYDRGNFISHLDVASLGPAAVLTTFYLSTVAPQVPAMNRGVWLKLEKYSRDLATSGSAIYAISGPVFADKETRSDKIIVIGERQVAVPTHYFRILARRTATGGPEALAFMIPNRSDARSDLRDYRVPISTLESVTGLRFLSDLESDQRNRIEATTAPDLWPVTAGSN